MKEKIKIFVIGFLAGAVMSTAIFCAYTLVNNSNHNNRGGIGGGPGQTQNGQPPELPGNNNGNGQPPEMPNNNGQNSSQ